MTFDATTDQFSQANACACAIQSALAYEQQPTIETDLAHVLISETAQAVLVAFRGTKSVRDFITDGQFWRERAGQFFGTIHKGFYRAIMGVLDPLMAHALKFPPKPIFIMGHSLGGDLAQLAAFWLCTRSIPARAVYTFGGARAGDKEWAKNYNDALGSRTWRVVNQEDIVPRIPGWLSGYRHSGQLALLPSFGDRMAMNPSPILTLKSDVIGLWRALRAHRAGAAGALFALDEFLADHHIDKYIARLAP